MKSQKLPMNESLLTLLIAAGIGCTKGQYDNINEVELCILEGKPDIDLSNDNTKFYKDFIRPGDQGDFLHFEGISRDQVMLGEYQDQIVVFNKIHCLAKHIVIPHDAKTGLRIYAKVGGGTVEIASKSSYFDCAHNYAMMAEKKLKLPYAGLEGAAKFSGEDEVYSIQPLPSGDPRFEKLSEEAVLKKYAEIFEKAPISLGVYYEVLECYAIPYKDYTNNPQSQKGEFVGYTGFDAKAVYIPEYKFQKTNELDRLNLNSTDDIQFDIGRFGLDFEDEATYSLDSGHDDIPVDFTPAN